MPYIVPILAGAGRLLGGGGGARALGAVAGGFKRAIGGIFGKKGTSVVRSGRQAAGAIIRNPRVIGAAKTAGGAIATGGAFEAGSRIVRGRSPDYNAGGGGGGDWNGDAGGAMAGAAGMPLVTDVIPTESFKAPRGYSVVRDPATGEPVAMLTRVAVALGLRKRRSRGGISSHEIKSAKKVQRVIQNLTTARQPKIKLRRKGR